VGHVTPEAIDGGPIALVEEHDLIELNIPERRVGIVGIGKTPVDALAIDRVLADRRARWTSEGRRPSDSVL
jgi:dihydroxyacid dehydratase/phosphogluconate dehydratase